MSETTAKKWRWMVVPFAIGAITTLILWTPMVEKTPVVGKPDPMVVLLMLPNLGVWLSLPLYYTIRLLEVWGRTAAIDPIPTRIIVGTFGNGLTYCAIWWMFKLARAGVSWPRWILAAAGVIWLGYVGFVAFLGPYIPDS